MTIESTIHIIIIANGFQTDYLLNFVTALSEHCKVVFICSDNMEKTKFNSNVVVKNLRGDHNPNVPVKNKVIRILRYYYKLFRFIQKSKVKVVHIQWLRFYLIDGLLFTLFARLTGKKVIYTAHDVLPHDRTTLINRLIFRLIYKSQNVIIVHTSFLKNRLHKEFNVAKNKVHFIEHGVYNVADSKEITFELARYRYNLSKEDFVVLFFGRIAKYKGIELIASNINRFSNNNINVKLIIAGEVSKDYETEFYKYFKTIDTSNIIKRFGFIDNHEVEFLFKSSNVTVLPYKEASQSGVLFLSYAYGTPIIAPKIGGFSNYIIQNKTGFLYNPDVESSFFSAVSKAIQVFSNLSTESRKNIKKFAYNNFSWSASCKKLNSIYMKYQ